MSVWENGLANYIEGRLLPLERAGKCYSFRSNSFTGRIQRHDGSTGFIKNSKKGMPDIVACFPKYHFQYTDGMKNMWKPLAGQFVGFELKTMTGRQSPEQKAAQETIEAAGGRYYVVRTPEQFEEVLKELM